MLVHEVTLMANFKTTWQELGATCYEQTGWKGIQKTQGSWHFSSHDCCSEINVGATWDYKCPGSAILVVVFGDIRCPSFIALTKTELFFCFFFLKLVNEILVSPCWMILAPLSLIYFFAWKKGVICITCINFDPDCISSLWYVGWADWL